jgi:peptidylprolyl isomerase
VNSLRFFALAVVIFATSCNQNMKEAPPKAPLPPGVQETYSGLRHQLIRRGQGGRTPNSLCTVKVHYVGKKKDGEIFENSYEQGEPVEFPLEEVIPGWTEGLQLMTRGEKRRFWIPARLAYGNNPAPGQPEGELVFDIELLDFHL